MFRVRSNSVIRINVNESLNGGSLSRQTSESGAVKTPAKPSGAYKEEGEHPRGHTSKAKIARRRWLSMWLNLRGWAPQAAVLLVLLGGLLLLLSSRRAAFTYHGGAFTEGQQQAQYTVYIDAGSSGTRCHVFQYTTSTWPAYVQLELPEATHAVEPGLSHYAGRPAMAAQSLQPLLEFAYQHVPEHLHAVTPVHLLATAGLRLLSAEDAQAILTECTSLLASSRLLFEAQWARIIGGDSEGLYAWAAANYVSGALEEASSHHHHSRKEIVQPSMFRGVLELGGASFQVTFMPEVLGGSAPDSSSQLRVDDSVQLPGITRPIFTHSFLGLGMDSAMRKAADLVREVHEAEERVSRAAAESAGRAEGTHARPLLDPCLPPGYEAPDGRFGAANFSACMEVVRKVLPARKCTSDKPAAGGGKHTIHLKGELGLMDGSEAKAGNAADAAGEESQSGSRLKSALQTLLHGRGQRCSVAGVELPPVAGTAFIGIENFFWTARAVGLRDTPTLEELREAGEAHCARTWASLHEAFAGHVPDQFISRYCFGAAYVFSLLHDVLGLPLNERSVLYTNSIPRLVKRPKRRHAAEVGAALGSANAHSAISSARHGQQNPDAADVKGETVMVGLNWVVGAMLTEAMHGARHGTQSWLMRGVVGGQGSGLPFGLPLAALLAIPFVLALLMWYITSGRGHARHQHHLVRAGHTAPLQMRPIPSGEGLRDMQTGLDLGQDELNGRHVDRSAAAEREWGGKVDTGEAKLRELEHLGAWGQQGKAVAPSRFCVEATSASPVLEASPSGNGTHGSTHGGGSSSSPGDAAWGRSRH